MFPDVPEISARPGVVSCESHFRQFDKDGNPLISPTDEMGVMQINIPAWGEKGKALGLDIYHSERDNIIMGRIVYDEQGIGAWTCAK